MKNKLLSAIVCTIALAGSLAGSTIAFRQAAIAQVMPPQQMLNALVSRCNRATEVTYRSAQLASPDGNTRVYAEGMLRKQVVPNSQRRQLDTARACLPDSRETVSRNLIIETEGSIRELTASPYNEGYILYQPRAFTADSRFLALDMRVAYTDGVPGSYVIFFDMEDETVVSAEVCDGMPFQNYIGFSSETEAVILCQDYGLADGTPVERVEAINLLDGSVRPLASQPEGLLGYGRIIKEFEVTSAQFFE